MPQGRPTKFTLEALEIARDYINGVTLGWDLRPHLSFNDGTYLPEKAEKLLYPQYFKSGDEWPRDPQTGEKLPIAEH